MRLLTWPGKGKTSHLVDLVQVGLKPPFSIGTRNCLASLSIFLAERSFALLVA